MHAARCWCAPRTAAAAGASQRCCQVWMAAGVCTRWWCSEMTGGKHWRDLATLHAWGTLSNTSWSAGLPLSLMARTSQ